MQLIRARHVFPIDRPPIADGAVLVEGGRIVAIGSAKTLRRQYPGADEVDLGQSLLLPGLVNAHTHLELSDRTAAPRVESFAGWIAGMVATGRQLPPPEQRVPAAAAVGARQCLGFGVTTVGDITAFPALTRPAIAAAGLRAVSYAEVLGLGAARPRFDAALASAVTLPAPPEPIVPGLSPHAPYTVDPDGFRQTLAHARQRRWPLATHLAESPEEAEFLRTAGGPFRDLWESLGTWRDDAVVPFDGSPLALAHHIGLLDDPAVLLAHVNYLDDADLSLLAGGRASVVWCPRTHAAFDHPPHRFAEMLGRGVNVCLGTDSRATSPDLNLLDDLRLVHTCHPAVPVETLLEMVTLRGARALGSEASLGSLAPGKLADLVAFPADGAHTATAALSGLLSTAVMPKEVWLGGRPIATRRPG